MIQQSFLKLSPPCPNYSAVSKCLCWYGLCVSVVLAMLWSWYVICSLERQGGLKSPLLGATLHFDGAYKHLVRTQRGGVGCVYEKVCVMCIAAGMFKEQKDPLSAKFQRKLSDVSILL